MAKQLFYLHALKGHAPQLLDAAVSLTSSAIFDNYSLHAAVMIPRDNDPLAAPAGSPFLPGLDVLLEMVAPAGVSLRACQRELSPMLSPLMTLVDRERSRVACGYHRCFQESGQKPVRYHYLMVRRQDFSQADYLDYYVHSHSRFGVATPLADYYQNYIDAPAGVRLAEVFGLKPVIAHSISELRFLRLKDYLSSDVVAEIGPAASVDEERFVDRPASQSFTMDVVQDTRDYSV